MDINSKQINHSITRFLHRYHVIIFVVIVLGALGVGIYLTYQKILATNDAQGYTAQANNTAFDTETIDRIKNLQPSNARLPQQTGSASSPAPRDLKIDGRINPFVE